MVAEKERKRNAAHDAPNARYKGKHRQGVVAVAAVPDGDEGGQMHSCEGRLPYVWDTLHGQSEATEETATCPPALTARAHRAEPPPMPLPNQHRAVVGAAGEEQQVEKVPPYDYAIDLAAAKEVATAIFGSQPHADIAKRGMMTAAIWPSELDDVNSSSPRSTFRRHSAAIAASTPNAPPDGCKNDYALITSSGCGSGGTETRIGIIISSSTCGGGGGSSCCCNMLVSNNDSPDEEWVVYVAAAYTSLWAVDGSEIAAGDVDAEDRRRRAGGHVLVEGAEGKKG